MQPLETSDPLQIGRYRMLARLGRGGMGRVPPGAGSDGRLVAVTLVDEQCVHVDGFRARFRREVRASRKVAGASTAALIEVHRAADAVGVRGGAGRPGGCSFSRPRLRCPVTSGRGPPRGPSRRP